MQNKQETQIDPLVFVRSLEHFIYHKTGPYLFPNKLVIDKYSCLDDEEKLKLDQRYDDGKLKSDIDSYNYHEILPLIRSYYDQYNKQSEPQIIDLAFKKLIDTYITHPDNQVHPLLLPPIIKERMQKTDAANARHEKDPEIKASFYKFVEQICNGNNRYIKDRKWKDKQVFIDNLKYEFSIYIHQKDIAMLTYQIELYTDEIEIIKNNFESRMNIYKIKDTDKDDEKFKSVYSCPVLAQKKIKTNIIKELKLDRMLIKEKYQIHITDNRNKVDKTIQKIKNKNKLIERLKSDKDGEKREYTHNIELWLKENDQLNARVEEMLKNNRKSRQVY